MQTLDSPPTAPQPAPAPDDAGARAALVAAAAAATLVLAACGGGGGAGPSPAPGSPAPPAPSPPAAPPPPTAGPLPTATEAARFLLQATLAPTDTAIADVMRLGYAAWLEQEFERPPSASNWDFLVANGIDQDEDARSAAIFEDEQIWQRLLGAPDGLRQRVALALSEIFVVGLDGLAGLYKQFQLAGWWDLLAENAFGDYRTLLERVTLNPAMGIYLAMHDNRKADAASGRMPDENFAREVMQLFSIGLVELAADGTPRLKGGQPVETYSQETVSQLARVFTGWSVDKRPADRSPELMRRPMVLDPTHHESGESRFLGATVPAGTGGAAALATALDTLAGHANVGPFLGRQLIQKLVTSNPSPAYVARVAAAWADDGSGARGNLRAVLRAILLDDEARGAAGLEALGHGKLREPLLRFIGWARAFGARSASGRWVLGDCSDPSTRLGQSPLRSPSVFNFYRPGYVPPATAIAAAGMVAPEMQLVHETSVAGYLNFMRSMVAGDHHDVRADYAAELPLAGDAAALVDRVELMLCARQLAPASRRLIRDAVAAMPAATDADRRARVHAAVLLVLAAPEALVQK